MNTALETLYAHENQLTGNVNLDFLAIRIETHFSCSSGSIPDFSKNTALRNVGLRQNMFSGALLGLPT